ncbi:nicotinamidase-related amidase [Paenibacillus taihuensis]|uniref:Nicotinamidase-related amidase n=1 Tax=Paenibacillus taihuensis TaxID=1156355 RepID=A0A3D9QWH5_9BACL|nr:isochorismatase family protein [Paenibacillus taihuensis]REE69633.1 nicotinamidase-related amidase [Paenibacillus taihuensis]
MEIDTRELRLLVRKYNAEPDLQINIVPERTAFLLVDCDEASAVKHVVEREICSALSTARESGMRIVYLYNAINGVGGPNDVTTKIHGLDYLENSWKPLVPQFNPLIRPLDNEAVIPKSHKDGFNGTMLDYYLKTWNIDTLITVGFHLKSCLFHTCVGARHNNYRVVMLRDCTNASEFPDTIDDKNPEGGWLRFVFLRIYETDIGYTSTSYDLKRAAFSTNGER